LNQVSAALAGGRLEEAAALLQQSPQGEQWREGGRRQKLVDEVVAALIARARAHLLEDRPNEALADCRTAQRLAGNGAEVAAIRDAATEQLLAQARRQRRENQVLAMARRHIEQGQLDLAERVVRQAANEILTKSLDQRSGAVAILGDIEARRAVLDAACTAAEAALARDDTDRATVELERARGADKHDARVAQIEARLRVLLGRRLAEAIDDGRPDLAEAFAARLRRCGQMDAEGEALCRVLEQCRAAWQWVQRGAPRQAGQLLGRVTAARPQAKWVTQAIEQLALAQRQIEMLRASPLGMLGGGSGGEEESRIDSEVLLGSDGIASGEAGRSGGQTGGRPGMVGGMGKSEQNALAERFLLQVDGAGSYLVVSGSELTIGPVSSPRRPTVGLVAEPGTPLATIRRQEDDYFLHGEAGVRVGDEPASGRLLRSGDRITLSPRCRVSFAVPHPASTTAVLDLTGARFPRSDVRRIILLDQDLIIGPGAGHVCCPDALRTMALRWRKGRLTAPAGVEVRADGQIQDAGRGLPTGVPIELGGLRMVITAI
jgi:hypothetical protein